MRRMTAVTVGAVVILASGGARALMPPMTEEQLTVRSNIIVEAEVHAMRCTGEFETNRCFSSVGYEAELDVKRTLKGEHFKRLKLLFMHTIYNEGCVGSPDTIHYVDEGGTYYLQCRGDRCRLTNWNGVRYERHGTKRLPKCEEEIDDQK